MVADSPQSTLNLCRKLFECSKVWPERCALTTYDRSFSYSELSAKVKRIAGWINSIAAGRKICVGILGARGAESYLGLLGAAWAGQAYVPLSPDHPPVRLKQILSKAKIEILIVEHDTLSLLSELSGVLPQAILVAEHRDLAGKSSITADAETLAAVAPLEFPAAVAPTDLAYIIFTSGTTGIPRGVMISIANVQALLRSIQQLFSFTFEDRFSQSSELVFDVSVFNIFLALGSGASLFVTPKDDLLVPIDFINRHKLSIWFSVPSTISMMRQIGRLKHGIMPTLRLSLFAGEVLGMYDAEAWRVAAPSSRIFNLYGPTEMTVVCTTQEYVGAASLTPERNAVSIGYANPGVLAAVVDDSGAFLQAGARGEIVFSGMQVSSGGYLDEQALTKSRFRRLSHPKVGEQLWYFSGDCGYQKDDGQLHLLGRIDNQVKVRGYRVELDEIDSQIVACSDVKFSLSVAWPVRDGKPQGIVTFITAGSTSAEELMLTIKQRLPAYMVPKSLIILERFPLNVSGKIDRGALIARLERGEFLLGP